MTVVSLPLPADTPLLVVDEERWEARVRGRRVHLTKTEFVLLAALHRADGRVLTRAVAADLVGLWGEASRSLDAHVCRLRAKLGPAAEDLVTVRGVGWRLLAD